MRGFAVCASLVLACGGKAPVPPKAPAVVDPVPAVSAPAVAVSQPAKERTLSADTAITTSAGATFTAPAGFTLREQGELVSLIEPAKEATLTFVAIGGGLGRDEAARAAWSKLDPAFALPVAQAQDGPASGGWHQLAQIMYVTPTEQARLVLAIMQRFRDTWYVALLDGKLAAVDRRGAQLSAAMQSLRVPGMELESFAGKKAVLDAKRLEALSQFVESARQEAGVPGAAVAVIVGDRIVLERGYGVRELGDPAPVTPRTRFMIGSTTKALTTLMMARLVDAKRLTWDTPVTQLWPSFALGDKATTAKVTLQHTVCACTGMPRRDLEFIFEFEGISPEARIASMREMQPSTGFGETFQYSNLMVAAGGYVASLAAPHRGKQPAFDAAYAAAMQAQVFGPLGMRQTTLYANVATKGEHALPHARGLTLAYQTIPLRIEGAVEAVRPAGAAWSTVGDLARYAMLELGEGTLGGKRLVSKESLLYRRTPQVKITDDVSYGLGLFIERDHGVTVVHHGGNTLGFTADWFFLPEHGVGAVVLSNAGGSNTFHQAVRRRFFELAFDGKPEAQEQLTATMANSKKLMDETRALIKSPVDTAWMNRLVGRYSNDDLGALELRRDGAGYVLDAGEWSCAVTQETDRDKTDKLLVTGAPYAGFELVPRLENGKTALVLQAGQLRYVFEQAN